MARTFTVNEVSRMLIQSLKVLSKTISGLSMFSKIGKLRVRKKFVYLSRGVCPKIMMFTVCKLLKNSLKTWTAFPQMSDLQSSSRKWLKMGGHGPPRLL